MAHNNGNAEILTKYFNRLLNCEEPQELLEMYGKTCNKSPLRNILPIFKEVDDAIKALKKKHQERTNWQQNCGKMLIKPNKICISVSWIFGTPKNYDKNGIQRSFSLYIKKGNKMDPNNHRGISLLDVNYKNFFKIFLICI